MIPVKLIITTFFCLCYSTTFAGAEEHIRIERGKPIAVLDAAANVVSVPQKIILFNGSIDNHRVGDATEYYLLEFLDEHRGAMKNVKVRINQCDIFGEFDRLISNKQINVWWRIFPGLPVTIWTALTGRLLGGDNYNPFTNTINLYSDSPSVALHEAGHALDFNSKSPGLESDFYAIGRILPPVALYQEFTATETAIDHLKFHNDKEEELKSYRVLYPAFGTYVGEYAGIPYGNAAGALVGHVVSIWKVHERSLPDAIMMGDICQGCLEDEFSQKLLREKEVEDRILYKGLISSTAFTVEMMSHT